MKKFLPTLTLLIALSISGNVYSQTLKEMLQRKKQEAADKAKAKADQKASEAIDKAINMPETMGKKKKEKEEKTSTATPAAANETTNGTANENGEFIIKTNIKCAAGKTLIEPLLLDTDGVNSVSIDVNTGKLFLSAGGNTTVYNEVIETLRANGFDADGKKAINKKSSPCK